MTEKQKRRAVAEKIILATVFFITMLFGMISLNRPRNLAVAPRKPSADPVVSDVRFAPLEDVEKAEKKSICMLSAETENAGSAGVGLRSSLNGFEMRNGAGVRLSGISGLRFQAFLPENLSETTDETFGMIIAPKSYFEKAIEQSGGEPVDYVNALKSLEQTHGATPALNMECTPTEADGKRVIQGSVGNILYENTNLSFAAAAYRKTADENGEVTYTYATYLSGTPSGIARSVSEVATMALNSGNAYTMDEMKILNGFISRGAAYAIGLTEREREIEISLEWQNKPTLRLLVGETYDLSVIANVSYESVEGTVTKATMLPLVWSSSNEGIVRVTSQGRAEALAAGKAMVMASYGNQTVSAEIECEELQTHECVVTNTSGYDLLSASPTRYKAKTGEEIALTFTVKEVATYGELSFRVNGKYYQTDNGLYTLKTRVTESTEFTVEEVFTSWEYFSGTSSIKYNVNADMLPANVILPTVTEKGAAITGIANNAFKGCTNLREIVIPANYTTIGTFAFQNCSALESIYVLGTGILTKPTSSLKTNWTNCNALQSIYVPIAGLKAASGNGFWGSKNGFWENNAHLKSIVDEKLTVERTAEEAGARLCLNGEGEFVLERKNDNVPLEAEVAWSGGSSKGELTAEDKVILKSETIDEALTRLETLQVTIRKGSKREDETSGSN